MAAAIVAATWITVTKVQLRDPSDPSKWLDGVSAGAAAIYSGAQIVFLQEPT